MTIRTSRGRESWSLRFGRNAHIRIYRGMDVPPDEAVVRVAPTLMRWTLEEGVRSAPSTLRSLYEALGGVWPSGLTRLERTSHEVRLVKRLADAFESGALVALMEEQPVGSWRWPEALPEVQPAAQPRPIRAPPPRPEPQVDAAAQAKALRDAAQSGVPFCEECEKLRQSQQPQRAAA
ncbi:hypothetical protein KRR26_22295 [Corallococcus sp. M34]|uniref:hypothetical protein n=1 Tax=Citreicoccus inhibens TaxID=2849499 RepID=UPI001C21BD22|nr:hypothetical protein [Citreicoccus inhibens]MBU8898346.1 hypothetical protein [Citreicoccus inhibens]